MAGSGLGLGLAGVVGAAFGVDSILRHREKSPKNL
jgi:hypothetical protein